MGTSSMYHMCFSIYTFGRIPTGIGNQAIVQVQHLRKEKAEQPTGVGMDLEAE